MSETFLGGSFRFDLSGVAWSSVLSPKAETLFALNTRELKHEKPVGVRQHGSPTFVTVPGVGSWLLVQARGSYHLQGKNGQLYPVPQAVVQSGKLETFAAGQAQFMRDRFPAKAPTHQPPFKPYLKADGKPQTFEIASLNARWKIGRQGEITVLKGPLGSLYKIPQATASKGARAIKDYVVHNALWMRDFDPLSSGKGQRRSLEVLKQDDPRRALKQSSWVAPWESALSGMMYDYTRLTRGQEATDAAFFGPDKARRINPDSVEFRNGQMFSRVAILCTVIVSATAALEGSLASEGGAIAKEGLSTIKQTSGRLQTLWNRIQQAYNLKGSEFWFEQKINFGITQVGQSLERLSSGQNPFVRNKHDLEELALSSLVAPLGGPLVLEPLQKFFKGAQPALRAAIGKMPVFQKNILAKNLASVFSRLKLGIIPEILTKNLGPHESEFLQNSISWLKSKQGQLFLVRGMWEVLEHALGPAVAHQIMGERKPEAGQKPSSH